VTKGGPQTGGHGPRRKKKRESELFATGNNRETQMQQAPWEIARGKKTEGEELGKKRWTEYPCEAGAAFPTRTSHRTGFTILPSQIASSSWEKLSRDPIRGDNPESRKKGPGPDFKKGTQQTCHRERRGRIKGGKVVGVGKGNRP